MIGSLKFLLPDDWLYLFFRAWMSAFQLKGRAPTKQFAAPPTQPATVARAAPSDMQPLSPLQTCFLRWLGQPDLVRLVRPEGSATTDVQAGVASLLQWQQGLLLRQYLGSF